MIIINNSVNFCALRVSVLQKTFNTKTQRTQNYTEKTLTLSLFP